MPRARRHAWASTKALQALTMSDDSSMREHSSSPEVAKQLYITNVHEYRAYWNFVLHALLQEDVRRVEQRRETIASSRLSRNGSDECA